MKVIKLFDSITKKPIRFYKYFLSYVFPILVIILILKYVIFRDFITTLQSEVELSNIAVLTQIKNIIDFRMKEIDHMAFKIGTSSNLAPYKAMKSGVDAYEAIKELEEYKIRNEFIYDIAVYYNYENNDRMLTCNVDVSIDRFFEYLYRYKNWGKEDFIETIADLDYPVVRAAELVEVNRYNPREFITYLYPFPLNVSMPYGCLILLISGDTLEDISKTVLTERQGSFFILDHDMMPLFKYTEGEERLNEQEVVDFIKNNKSNGNVHIASFSDKQYSIISIPSEYNQWTYVIVMPSHQFMGKIDETRALFNVATVFIFLLGLLSAYAFATGNYKPLENLMNLVSEIKSTKNTIASKVRHIDEFKIISGALNEVSEENTALRVKIRSKAGMLREQVLWKLLNGKVKSSEKLEGLCDLTPIRLDFPYFAVMIVMIDDIQKLKKSNEKSSTELMKFSIINVIEELGEDIGYGYGIELTDERFMAFILNLKENCAKESSIRKIAVKAKEIFMQHFSLSITIGIGSIYSDVSMIRESFQEANRAIYYRMIKGSNNVIFYKDTKNNPNGDYKYPVDLETSIVMAIKQGDIKKVEDEIEKLISYMIEQMLTPELVQLVFFGIINAIVKCMDEIGIEIKYSFVGDNDSTEGTFFETMDDLRERMLDFCSQICASVEKERESKSFEIRDRVFAIVREKYSDSTLCIESIADELGISASHLCRCFREQAGTSLMQYIDNVRMNEAKWLLRNTRLQLRDIISRTGYLNESSFIRKFKRMEGITPIQYRSIACNTSRTG